MADITCTKCGQPTQAISGDGLCWNCYQGKEKKLFRYLVNSRTKLLIYSLLLCIFFLLNAIPTIWLLTDFTKQYSLISNDYIKYGKDFFIIAIYLLLKLSFTISILKARYTGIGSNYLHLIPELLIFTARLLLVHNYRTNSTVWSDRLQGFSETLSTFTEDTMSSTYIAYFLVFTGIMLSLRALGCFLSIILNSFRKKRYAIFFANAAKRKRIGMLAYWENHYKHHPVSFSLKSTPIVAPNITKPVLTQEADLVNELGAYTKDPAQITDLLDAINSKEDTVSLNQIAANNYMNYIKDKLSQWKEYNNSIENYLDQDIISEFSLKYSSILNLYQECGIEGETSYSLMNNYNSNFDAPLLKLGMLRKKVRESIEHLYSSSDAMYWSEKTRQQVNEVLTLLDKQVINLSSIYLNCNDTVIPCDNLIITNRGLFILSIQTLDTTGDYVLRIEKDGSWWKAYTSGMVEPASCESVEVINRNLLQLEKQMNESMHRSLDEYIEIHPVILVSNEELKIENDSTQAVIRMNELVTYIRQYPLLYNEEFMDKLKNLFESLLCEAPDISIPNYRKLIIDQLSDLLSQKIQLLNQNASLIQQVDKISNDFTHPCRFSFLPTLILK